MQTADFAKDVLQRLPLAEAVLLLWQWQADDTALDQLFHATCHAAYTKQLRFATLVHLIADALLQHGGSGRQSFQRGHDCGELTVSIQAAYQKLGRLPLAVSETFLAASTQRLLQLLPPGQQADTPVPDSLRALHVMAVDGKVIKGVPKRLRPLRHSPGGVLGGKALVALHLASGLAVAMATDADGQSNEVKLVPQLLPQVRPHFASVLWLADRQFGNPAQAAAFTARPGDHFVLRHDGKTAFTPDPNRPVQRGQDVRGRAYEQDWGWLGGPRNKQPCYVRRIRLDRPDAEPIVLVSDLGDEQAYPAVDLLELYLARWGIERVFQQITEVFQLQRLIGTTPRGTLFQLALCLLLYNQIQVVRAYVAAGAQRPVQSVSSELLFVDVRRQLIALNEVLQAERIVALLTASWTVAALRRRLGELLHGVWTDRWQKSPPKKVAAPHPKTGKREHASAYRLIQEYRLAQNKECKCN